MTSTGTYGAAAPERAMRGAAADTGRGNVLCVANFPSDTGYAWRLMERLWVHLAHIARAGGGDVIVAFPQLNGVSQILREAGVRTVELKVPTSPAAPLSEVKRFVRENAIRTLYLTDRHYWSPAYARFRRWGVESIIVHDHIPGDRPRPSWWKLAAKRLRHHVPGTSADLYIGVSKFVHDRFTRVAGVPAERCTFVRNGVDVTITSGPDPRGAFGIPAGAPVVVSSGRLTHYKGIDFMIRCAARLIHGQRRSDVHFLHFGDGPHRAQFEALVAELGLQGRFILAGVQEDAVRLLPACTVALHASRGEAFSLAILEFMAAGLPAIVPDNCGNGEAIEHGATGVLYRPGDIDGAAQWLARLLDDEALRRRMGEAARQRARREFTLERMDRDFVAAVTPYTRT